MLRRLFDRFMASCDPVQRPCLYEVEKVPCLLYSMSISTKNARASWSPRSGTRRQGSFPGRWRHRGEGGSGAGAGPLVLGHAPFSVQWVSHSQHLQQKWKGVPQSGIRRPSWLRASIRQPLSRNSWPGSMPRNRTQEHVLQLPGWWHR
jgi:hypothetical protein